MNHWSYIIWKPNSLINDILFDTETYSCLGSCLCIQCMVYNYNRITITITIEWYCDTELSAYKLTYPLNEINRNKKRTVAKTDRIKHIQWHLIPFIYCFDPTSRKKNLHSICYIELNSLINQIYSMARPGITSED